MYPIFFATEEKGLRIKYFRMKYENSHNINLPLVVFTGFNKPCFQEEISVDFFDKNSKLNL